MKLFNTVSTETALFVTADKAKHVCDIALLNARVREATYRRRYRRGAMLGYCVTLTFHDDTRMDMSEDHAAELV